MLLKEGSSISSSKNLPLRKNVIKIYCIQIASKCLNIELFHAHRYPFLKLKNYLEWDSNSITYSQQHISVRQKTLQRK